MDLSKAVFEAINGNMTSKGLMMRDGAIADATILAAPPSVKNQAKARDPEIHQTNRALATRTAYDDKRFKHMICCQLSSFARLFLARPNGGIFTEGNGRRGLDDRGSHNLL